MKLTAQLASKQKNREAYYASQA